MTVVAPTNSAIVTDYKARTPGSGALFERAHKVLPSGITHDARYLDPYSIHVAKAIDEIGFRTEFKQRSISQFSAWVKEHEKLPR